MILCHLPQQFEKGPLPDFSTERFESETSQKDKNNTNNTYDILRFGCLVINQKRK